MSKSNQSFLLDLAVWYSVRYLILRIPALADKSQTRWKLAVNYIVRSNSRYFKVDYKTLGDAVAAEMFAVLEGRSTVQYDVEI